MEFKIDIRNRRILNELDRNCRQSFANIGKNIGLAKNSVKYRIMQLEEEGIIKGYRAVIDVAKLGYQNYRIYINLQNTTLEKEKEIFDYINKYDIVSYSAYMEGNYNLSIHLVSDDVNKVHEFWDNLFQRYVNYFAERLLTIDISSTYFFRSYLTGAKKNVYELKTSKFALRRNINDIDLKLVKILSENARERVIDIAEKLDLSPKTVISKIKNLEKEKIIIAYRAILDLDKLKYRFFKLNFLLLKLTPKKDKEFLEFIKNHPNIIRRYESVGGEDLELDIEVKNLKELMVVLEDIRKKFGEIIQDYKIFHVEKEYKK